MAKHWTRIFREEQSESERIKTQASLRLSQFFRIEMEKFDKFKFDGKDDLEELTKILDLKSDQDTKLFYETAIELAKKDK